MRGPARPCPASPSPPSPTSSSRTKEEAAKAGPKAIKVWEFVNGGWKLESALVSDMHTECMRDVAWAPVLGLAKSTIASDSQDGKVVIWTKGNSSVHGNSGIVRAQFRSNLLASSMVRLSPSRRRRIMVCLLRRRRRARAVPVQAEEFKEEGELGAGAGKEAAVAFLYILVALLDIYSVMVAFL